MKAKYKILSFIPALCIMSLIFYFSSQTAGESSGLSGGIAERFLNDIINISNTKISAAEKIVYLGNMETVIRKAAHMVEYAVLGIAVAFPGYIYGKRRRRLIIWSEVICLMYAATDEFHQLYVLGRSGQVSDVIIDGIGALIGCFLFLLISRNIVKVTINRQL